jgi:hypothetical protein
MLIVIGTFIVGLIYFAPALLATACHHPRLVRVWAINLFGFTLIGWVLALKETIDGVHHVYGKHSPEGNLLIQRFTFNRYFVLAVVAIGLMAISVYLGLRQIRQAPPPPVAATAPAAGECTPDQVMVRMNGTTACLTASSDRVRVRFDDAPHTLSWDEANSPMYADQWKTAHHITITADIDTPEPAPASAAKP